MPPDPVDTQELRWTLLRVFGNPESVFGDTALGQRILAELAVCRDRADRTGRLEEALRPLLSNSFTWHPRSDAERASFDAVMETIRLARAALATTTEGET